MSNLAVAAFFTDGGGTPATGLTLADIDLYLTSQNKTTGVDAVVWNGTQNPTEEIDNVGAYARIYATADLDTYNYFLNATYTGVAVLDVDNVQGSYSLCPILDEIIEGTLTTREVLRIALAALAGKSTGGGTVSPAFRDVADSKDRIDATVDAQGNRTAIVLDGS